MNTTLEQRIHGVETEIKQLAPLSPNRFASLELRLASRENELFRIKTKPQSKPQSIIPIRSAPPALGWNLKTPQATPTPSFTTDPVVVAFNAATPQQRAEMFRDPAIARKLRASFTR
ncbi:MAG: hypothetical protein WCI55_17340 [Armatimonadota bacterium]